MTQTAVARTVTDLRAELTRGYAPALARLLPSVVKPERVITLAMLAASREPKLMQCSTESIALALLRIAQWDLEIGTTAHLVPFFDKTSGKMICTPIADWKGLVQMILRSPKIKDVVARPVFSKEHFVRHEGDRPLIEHEPIWGSARGEFVGAYAIAFFRPTGSTHEAMSKDEIDAIRAKAPSKDSPAWKDHYHEMAKKTVVRRLAKRLPHMRTDVFEDAALEPDERPSPIVQPMRVDELTGSLTPAQLASAGADVYADDQADDERELALQDQRKEKEKPDTRIRD